MVIIKNKGRTVAFIKIYDNYSYFNEVFIVNLLCVTLNVECRISGSTYSLMAEVLNCGFGESEFELQWR